MRAGAPIQWAPHLPEHWGVARGRDAAHLVKREPVAGDGIVTAFRDGEVTLRERRRTEGFTEALQEIGYQGVRQGDLVIHGMDGFAGAIGVSDSDGKMSPVVHIYEVRQGDARFLAHALRVAASSGYIQALAKGIRERSTAFDRRAFREMLLPYPPAEEQRAIADYLDRETAQIDTLIAKQEQLITTLRERRDASWARSFHAASLAYPVVPLRRLIESIVDGPFGSSLTSSHYSDSGARVIRLGNIGVNSFRGSDEAYIPLAYYEELSAHAVVAGDVVIAGLGDEKMPLGRAAVVPDLGPAIVKADCYRVRPDKSVSPRYLAWALSSPQAREQSALNARGSTRARLNTSVVQRTMLPFPPRSEQERIVGASDTEISAIDSLIAKAEQFIALAKERRAALITAAVSGQIDVRESAAVARAS